jgi:hypothetical protein
MGAFLKRADFIIPAGYGQAFWKLFVLFGPLAEEGKHIYLFAIE